MPQHDEEFVRLEPKQFELIDAVMTRSVAVRASFETLARHIFAAGMSVTSKAFPVTEAMTAAFNGPWLRFCRDCLLYVFAYGFVLVRLRPDTGVPVALNPLEYEITIVRKPRSVRLYRLMERPSFSNNVQGWPTKMRKPVNDVMVWEKNAPDFQGCLTSIVPTLMQLASFQNLMVACASKAELRRAVPVMFLEHVPEGADAKIQAMDVGIPGNNNMMYQDALAQEAGADMARIQDNEERVRRANVLRLGNLDSDIDPVNGQMRYPVDENGLPFYNIPVPIPYHRRLAQNTPSESPAFLLDLMKFTEADVAKVTGVPAGLFDTAQSNVASNITTMNIFYATQQDHRMMLTTIVGDLLSMIYHGEAIWNAFTQYNADPKAKHPREHLLDNSFQISFPGLLDPEILNMFQDRGAMHWDTWCGYVSRYFGVPRDHLSAKQLDVVSDRPLEDVQKEQQMAEQKMALIGIVSKPTPSAGGAGTKRKAPGGGAKKDNTAVAKNELAAITRSENSQKLGKRTKRPGSAVPGVPRGTDVSS